MPFDLRLPYKVEQYNVFYYFSKPLKYWNTESDSHDV